jgi:hypothetical protein
MQLTCRGLFGALARIVLAPYASKWTLGSRQPCLTIAQIAAVSARSLDPFSYRRNP